MDNSHIENLIAKKIADDINSHEDAELQNWLNDSPDNPAIFDEYVTMWETLAPEKPKTIPDAQIELNKLKNQLSITSEQHTANIYSINNENQGHLKSTWFKSNFKNYAMAASILIMLTFGYLFNQMLFSETSINTTYAETKEVILPDGSVIKLNSGSELSYSNNFNSETRLVNLSGEAFFEVTSSDIQFIVKTTNASITVVGTKFNIRSRKNKTTLIVQEGTVAFSSNKSTTEKLILHANEMSICEDVYSPVPVRRVNAEKLLGWLNGTIIFNEASIYEVAEELERTYNVEIDVAIQQYHETVSGSFKDKSIDNVLEAVCIALGLNHEKRGEKYIIEII
jgi:ferric-dicitrate binding protein FerR (iron transport regulator)